VEFADAGTEDIYHGVASKAARRTCPGSILKVVRRKLEQLAAAEALDDLRSPPGNRLEALAGDRTGQHSLRINDQYRICFKWTDGGPTAIEIADYY